MPPHNSSSSSDTPQWQRQQLGPARDMLGLLARQRAQFLLSVGNASHFSFLQDLPAQVGMCVCVGFETGGVEESWSVCVCVCVFVLTCV
jgi:hypothetical protein